MGFRAPLSWKPHKKVDGMAFEGMATPLGMKPGHSQRGVPSSWRWGLLALLLVCVVVMGFLSGLRFNRKSTETGVVAVIERMAAGNGAMIERGDATVPEKAAGNNPLTMPRSGAAEVEANSGVNVVRQNGGTVPGGMVIKVPDQAERPVSADARVGERSALGILPRISDSGLLPRQIYARPFLATGKPMIGIVMTGVGIGARGTTDAITKLPGEVTLAFAPYGRDLENQVSRARRDGHEVMLQVPMEPQDYPESDPGPHTLKVAASSRENIERLHWLMSRFSGYVGLTNFMGSKLMGETGPYGGLLEEMNRRGLLFLDDGTSVRSKTLDLGKKIGLPVRIADRIAETGGTKSLDVLLQEVEDLARKNGSAILSVPALSGNIDKIAAWERDLATRGVVLAPVSTIIGRPAR